MITAVQERSTRDASMCVVFGDPLRRVRGVHGPIALFAPGTIVAYRIRQRRYATGCVFRTANDDVLEAEPVPGVSPAPALLIGFVRGKLFERAVSLVRELARRGIADTLDNDAFLRAAFALGRPGFDASLMADALEATWIC